MKDFFLHHCAMLAQLQTLRFSWKLYRYTKGSLPEGAVCVSRLEEF